MAEFLLGSVFVVVVVAIVGYWWRRHPRRAWCPARPGHVNRVPDESGDLGIGAEPCKMEEPMKLKVVIHEAEEGG